jgi:Lamin Tail Domain
VVRLLKGGGASPDQRKEEPIIRPDPAPVAPGPQPGPPVAAADVLIVAALPNPVDPDAGAESVTLLNASPAAVDLAGWALSDAAGGRQRLGGSIESGGTLRVRLTGAVQLSNQRDTVRPSDARGNVIDQVAYQRNQVRAGRTIVVGR